MGIKVNANSIRKEIETFANSTAGKQKIRIATSHTMKQLANELVNCIEKNLPESIKGTMQNSFISEPELQTDGSFVISINIPTDEVWRDSLYSGGVFNIVALLNNGYHASKTVYGEWHGKIIRSLKDREGAYFMQKAINEFNAKYSIEYGCNAELAKIYE